MLTCQPAEHELRISPHSRKFVVASVSADAFRKCPRGRFRRTSAVLRERSRFSWRGIIAISYRLLRAKFVTRRKSGNILDEYSP